MCSYYKRDISILIANITSKHEMSFEIKEGGKNLRKVSWAPKSKSLNTKHASGTTPGKTHVLEAEAWNERVNHACGARGARRGRVRTDTQLG